MAITRLGKYELHEELGKGSFGIVYRASDPALDRDVAIKVLKPLLSQDVEFIEQFRAEAKRIAKLVHPNIVMIHSLDVEEGRYYMVMNYLPGGNLRNLLDRSEPLTFEFAWLLIQDISKGLNAAHTKGIIHRDIKPENILLTEDGHAVISDFGLAKALQSSSGSSNQAGVGTAYYRPPELWRGKPPATQATDQYSMACVFVEMLTGLRLFDGDSPEVIITKHLVDGAILPESWPEGIPGGINPILEKALDKDPGKRYETILNFTDAIEQVWQAEVKRWNEVRAAQKKADEERRAQIAQLRELGRTAISRKEWEPAHQCSSRLSTLGEEGESEAAKLDKEIKLAHQEEARREAEVREREIIRLIELIRKKITIKDWEKANHLLTEFSKLGGEGRLASRKMAKELDRAIKEWVSHQRDIHGSEENEIINLKVEAEIDIKTGDFDHAREIINKLEHLGQDGIEVASQLRNQFPNWYESIRGRGKYIIKIFIPLFIISVILILMANFYNTPAPPNTLESGKTTSFLDTDLTIAQSTAPLLTELAKQKVTTTFEARLATVRADSTSTAQFKQEWKNYGVTIHPDALLKYGPVSGILKHNEDNFLETYGRGLLLKNFIAQVTYFNPYPTSFGNWDYGFLFRDRSFNNQLRVYVRSDKSWSLTNRTDNNSTILADGKLSNLDQSDNGKNELRIICVDAIGKILVNDFLIAEVDISDRMNSGGVSVAIGFLNSDEINGNSTSYENFVVWSLP